MKELLIDTSQMHSLNEVHRLFCTQLHFPSYYGNNLDALYDILSVWDKPLTITLRPNADKKFDSLVHLLFDVSRENPHIHILIEKSS